MVSKQRNAINKHSSLSWLCNPIIIKGIYENNLHHLRRSKRQYKIVDAVKLILYFGKSGIHAVKINITCISSTLFGLLY
jgi:hypothetical protein